MYLLFFVGAIQQSIQLPRLTTKQAVTTEFFIFYVFILFYQFLCETKVPYGHTPLEMHLLCAGTSFRPYASRVCIMIMGCGHGLRARSSWAQWSRHSTHRLLLHPRPQSGLRRRKCHAVIKGLLNTMRPKSLKFRPRQCTLCLHQNPPFFFSIYSVSNTFGQTMEPNV